MTPASRTSGWIRGLPIRRKLRIVVIVTTVVALLLGGSGIVVADSAIFYQTLKRDLATFAQIIGNNTTGALAFDDQKAATETLGALRARTHVEIACLFRQTGALFAQYVRPDYQGTCVPPPPGGQSLYEKGSLIVSNVVELEGRPLGVLVLRYDLQEITERIVVYSGMVLGALILACAATIALSSRLRALITEPILELAGVARSVSKGGDYRVRAVKHSDDEIGLLSDSLNQMMDGIEQRDGDLRAALAAQNEVLGRLRVANADLQKTIVELGRSNSDLERFAFMASHDLQEPLRMITSYSQLLVAESQASQAGSVPQYMEQIVSNTKRLRELIADLLSYTEIAGSAEQPTEAVDLNLTIKAARDAAAMSGEAAITADALPILYAHPGRMASLFQNLIGNAIKYRGEKTPQIHISALSDEIWFNFAVADNGIGIDPRYSEKIFVAFQRLHGKEIPGSGIGLAICKRVVERYGGKIWVDSALGAGSTFHFTLPKSMGSAEK